jgi:AraC family transcriptional regulator of arabinose operon
MRDFFLYIHTFDGLPHFPRPDCIGKETRNTRAYRVEGRWRRDRPRVIFQYTLAGSGLFKDDRGLHQLRAGRGFLCEAHDPTITYYYPHQTRDPWHFIFIDILGSAAHAMARDLIRRFGAIYDLPLDHVIIQKLLSFHVYHEVGCILSLRESTRLTTDLLDALVDSKTPIPEKQADHTLIRRFHDIIKLATGKRISVGEIAARLSVSAEHLSRIVKQQTGVSPHDHIQNTRMLAACSLLKTESLFVKEIASRLGYETSASFMRTFQRVLHCTPTQFRRNGIMPLTFGPSETPKKPAPPSPLGKPKPPKR